MLGRCRSKNLDHERGHCCIEQSGDVLTFACFDQAEWKIKSQARVKSKRLIS